MELLRRILLLLAFTGSFSWWVYLVVDTKHAFAIIIGTAILHITHGLIVSEAKEDEEKKGD